ncbi:hypothetical protein BGZ57DRAFT_1004441 [Hyaloscypha finlandica]|nr:hypothetical protein BGZ57DRAFT_1004441 [Hyaloscypha finlandica]
MLNPNSSGNPPRHHHERETWHELREGLKKHKVDYEKAGRTFAKYKLRNYRGGSTQIGKHGRLHFLLELCISDRQLMDSGKMYSFGGNMTDSKGIALPVNLCTRHATPQGSASFTIGGRFQGPARIWNPKVCFCCDAASNYHPTGTSYSHSKRHQTISPFLDAEPQFLMDLPTNKFLQTFTSSPTSPQNYNSISGSTQSPPPPPSPSKSPPFKPSSIPHPTAKIPSNPPVPSPPSYTLLTPPALSPSQRWLLSCPFSNAGGGANT